MATGSVLFCELCAGHPAGGTSPFSLIVKVPQAVNYLLPGTSSLRLRLSPLHTHQRYSTQALIRASFLAL